MHIIIWEFVVSLEQTERFTAAYGACGEWVQLFRRADGYLSTELLRSTHSDRFLTLDRWQNESCFESFRAEFAEEYRRLDEKLMGISISERRIGVFYLD